MQILNPILQGELDAGRPVKLNLGGGLRPLQGHFLLDLVDLPGVDVQADLNEPLDKLPTGSVEAVHCRHLLEHIDNLLPLLEELHRVVRPGGEIDIRVPHFSNPYGYSDPTHVRFFGLYSFYYFADQDEQPRRKVPAFYSRCRFQVKQIHIRLMHATWFDKVVRTVLQPLINRSSGWQDWYERRLCRLFPANEIQYRITPVAPAQEKAKARAA
jgi:SAM-dependent methyltransferase